MRNLGSQSPGPKAEFMARWKGGEAGGDGRGGERDPATPKGCQFRGIATVPRNRLRRSQNGATMVGMVARLWIVVSCIPLAVLSGCTTVNQSGTCVPGASVACACPTGQQGAQTCNSAGTFGVCQCSVPGATDAAPDVLKASLDQAPDTQGPEVGSGGAGGTSMPNPFAGGAGGNGGASSFSSSGGAGGVPNPFAGGASGTGGADTMPTCPQVTIVQINGEWTVTNTGQSPASVGQNTYRIGPGLPDCISQATCWNLSDQPKYCSTAHNPLNQNDSCIIPVSCMCPLPSGPFPPGAYFTVTISCGTWPQTVETRLVPF